MYGDVHLALALLFVVGGLFALAWSSDYFVDAAANLAKLFKISPFIIGMVIIGFGTSAPELCVSALSGASGHSNIALGNAYGSCIFNVLVILGLAAVMRPVVVKSSISFVAVPILFAITVLEWLMLRDGVFSRWESLMLLAAFAIIMPVYCWFDQCGDCNCRVEESEHAPRPSLREIGAVSLKIVLGLSVLIASSHFLVWGSVDLARAMGVSELMIGLTIVAVGTSLPELASAIASVRKGEHEFVTGNIVGSNLFNMLAVVGIAGSISPIEGFSPYVASRDMPLLMAITISMTAFGANWRRLGQQGRFSRQTGWLWIALFVGYSVLMFIQETR